MEEVQLHGLQVSYITTAYVDDDAYGTETTSQLNASHSCFCATHERPKVEYSYCYSSFQTGIEDCANIKVAEGWYPLGGIGTNTASTQTAYGTIVQAFWRWAE